MIYALRGDEFVQPYFQYDTFISVISEIEILSSDNLNSDSYKAKEAIINYCTVILLTNLIKKETIRIRQQYKIKLPDAIIAATAIVEGFTLVTADKGFRKIKGLSLILLETN
ncbi:MAG: type II toxin-antitoxin system VapC family toxin [Bacteroidota bacterium]